MRNYRIRDNPFRANFTYLARWANLAILCISPNTYACAKNKDNTDWSENYDVDVMQRISLVLNIHSSLRLIFDNPDNVYGFVGMKNDNEFFNGRSPLGIMAQGDFISLYETFKHIESLRGTD